MAELIGKPTVPADFLDSGEIQRRMGFACRQTVMNYTRRGLLPRPIVIGRKYLWHRSEFEEFAEKLRKMRDVEAI